MGSGLGFKVFALVMGNSCMKNTLLFSFGC
ncbi:hypothetical protein KL86CLO1_13338 [uncultured Eubacteriales bacterium]|uniref:Uncharacterized protein n=1 Tax=uncultured Eubacteriales bacterium TaxID=172733 RepID=A0A212KIW5_9FIRM|nr:hypothetical protein KL86CLO1_13338 [uncultured Eubacteriales bacterium]